jgi:hypothetical protein
MSQTLCTKCDNHHKGLTLCKSCDHWICPMCSDSEEKCYSCHLRLCFMCYRESMKYGRLYCMRCYDKLILAYSYDHFCHDTEEQLIKLSETSV